MRIKPGQLFILILFMIVMVGCGTEETKEQDSDQDQKQSSSETTEFNIAFDAQPPSLDQTTNPAAHIRYAARLMFENLVTLDSNSQVQPMLAESFEVSDDSQTYTFYLREGIEFHNGKEMTAEDVVASMYHWLENSGITGNVFEGAIFEAADDYTVVLELAQSSALALDVLASPKQAADIMPKEVIEEASAEGIAEYIGTGPYEFVEWKQDQYIHFTKYDGYQPVEASPDGLAGKKEALIDDIYFHIVTDSSTRLAGLKSGEYDFAFGVAYDDYELVEEDEDLELYSDPYGESVLFYNKNAGPTKDFKMRQAINMALDVDSVMEAAYVNEDFYSLTSSYMNESIVTWATEIGSDYYNQNDPEKAKEILAEIGYDGEEIRLMSTRDLAAIYDKTVVIEEQLSEIGLNMKLEIYDWPTFNDRLANEADWDMLVTSSSIVSTPSQLIALSPSFAGGVVDDYVIEQMKEIEKAPTQEEAIELWEELQLYVWEEHLPVTNLGGHDNLYGANKKFEGYTFLTGPIFWNVQPVD